MSGKGHSYNYRACAGCDKTLTREERAHYETNVYEDRVDFTVYCPECAVNIKKDEV